MHSLPLSSSPVLELFEVRDLVNIHYNPLLVPTVAEVKRAGRNAEKGVKSIVSFMLAANDDLFLVRVGRRGGIKKLWKFGKV